MAALLSGGRNWGGGREGSLAEGWPQDVVGTKTPPGTKVENYADASLGSKAEAQES